MKQPASVHPLLGLDVEFNGEAGTIVEVYAAMAQLPERAMVDLRDHPGRLPVIPTARLTLLRRPPNEPA